MPFLSAGDRVVCHIKDCQVVNIYEDKWDEKRVLDIICQYEAGYLIYVPSDLPLKDTVIITESNYKTFNAKKKFINSIAYYITDYKVVSVYSRLDGLSCSCCDEFIPMGQPNQSDGKTLVCWNCKNYPFYK